MRRSWAYVRLYQTLTLLIPTQTLTQTLRGVRVRVVSGKSVRESVREVRLVLYRKK